MFLMQSVAYTAFPIMASAGIWFLVFGLFLIFVCCCCFFLKSGHGGYSQVVYFTAVILIILFTIVAMYVTFNITTSSLIAHVC